MYLVGDCGCLFFKHIKDFVVRPCLKGSTISFVGEVLHTLRILLLLLTPCSKVHVRLVLRNLLEVSASKFEIIRYWPSRLQAQNYTENFSFFS